MPTLSSSVAKQLRHKVETTWGLAPGASGAQLLRRVESTLGLSKDTYQSNEIRPDYQVADFRHGVRRVQGNIKGELSPGTYKDFIAAALRRDFTAVTAITGASITIAGTGPTYTVTRAAGSFLTDGIKVGDVVRLSVGSFNAANLNKNLIVLSVVALVLTVMPLNGVALVAEGPIATSTVSLPGKKTYIPTTGHLDRSFSIEHWHSDTSLSELYRGCKISTVDINLPSTGMAEINMGIIGADVTTAASAYYTSPTAATSTGVAAAVGGVLIVNGAAVAICTGLSVKIDGSYGADAVIGSNAVPAIFAGVVKVSGQFTAYFQDAVLRDNFINEDEITLAIALAVSPSAAADFVSVALPRIKLGSADRGDGDKGIIATFSFTALYNSAGGAGTNSEQTTVSIQDSQA